MRKRTQPPSRVRYARDHPTVGIHVTLEELQLLKTLSGESGLSVSQLVKQALGILKADIDGVRKHCVQEGITNGRREGRAEGRREGYAEAVARYRITYPCSKGGEPIVILADSKSAAAAAAMLSEAGWGHVECPEQTPPIHSPRAMP
jgi:hypothetical protein